MFDRLWQRFSRKFSACRKFWQCRNLVRGWSRAAYIERGTGCKGNRLTDQFRNSLTDRVSRGRCMPTTRLNLAPWMNFPRVIRLRKTRSMLKPDSRPEIRWPILSLLFIPRVDGWWAIYLRLDALGERFLWFNNTGEMINVKFLIGEQTGARGFGRNNSTIIARRGGPIDTIGPARRPILVQWKFRFPRLRDLWSRFCRIKLHVHGQIQKSYPSALIHDNCKRAINTRR